MTIRHLVRLGLLLSLGVTSAVELSAQGTGRIVGRVVEGQQGAPLAGATVELVGTDRSVVSALDGRYLFEQVPAGPTSLRVRMIGFGPKVVTGIVVPEGGAVQQNIALAAEVVQLAEISVSAAAERTSRPKRPRACPACCLCPPTESAGWSYRDAVFIA